MAQLLGVFAALAENLGLITISRGFDVLFWHLPAWYTYHACVCARTHTHTYTHALFRITKILKRICNKVYKVSFQSKVSMEISTLIFSPHPNLLYEFNQVFYRLLILFKYCTYQITQHILLCGIQFTTPIYHAALNLKFLVGFLHMCSQISTSSLGQAKPGSWKAEGGDGRHRLLFEERRNPGLWPGSTSDFHLHWWGYLRLFFFFLAFFRFTERASLL